MALSIKSETADRLARELSELTGTSITEAVTNALAQQVDAARRVRQKRRSVLDLALEFRRLPVIDPRPADEIIGYDSNGLPI